MDKQSFFKSLMIAALFIGVIAFGAVSLRPGTSSNYAQGGYSGGDYSNTGWIQNWSRKNDDDD